MKQFYVAGLAALTAGALVVGPGVASAQDGFYKGRTVNIVVGFSPGGGYDTYARTLARHLDAHVPGNPRVIVQNMPGAGSLTAVRHLDAVAPKDGTVMVAFNPGVITESFANPEKVKLKLSDFAWVGSITRDFRVCYAWHATGIKTFDDVLKRKEYVMGATAAGTGSYVNGAIMRNVFGANIKHILGYPGSAEQRIAIERGELEGDCGSMSSIPREWVENNRVNVFVRFSPARTPDIPENVPFIGEYAKTAEQKALLNILIAPGELGRPYIMSKQVPTDRINAMRAAFWATVNDKSFLADAQKQNLPVFPVNGEDAAKIIDEIYAAPPELLAKASAAIK